MGRIYRSLCFFFILILVACSKNDIEPTSFKLQGITKENYPIVDGSTSTQPLQTLIACKLLGLKCDWQYDWGLMAHSLFPLTDNEDLYLFIFHHVKNTGTHSSIVNLIKGNADFILTARQASGPERALADSLDVELIETPVAIDAFVFILNKDNPVNALTTPQIQDIYTGAITNWNQVGGNHVEIHPFVRNATSGSQVLMETLVMKGLAIPELPTMQASPTMSGPFDLLSWDVNGICYTVYYYKQFMARAENVKHISIDGVNPGQKTLKNRTYPYTTDVYAIIREDLDKTSPAYQLYQLILTEAGEEVIKESGYVPY